MAGEVFVVDAKKAVLPALAAHWRLPCVAGSTAFLASTTKTSPAIAVSSQQAAAGKLRDHDEMIESTCALLA